MRYRLKRFLLSAVCITAACTGPGCNRSAADTAAREILQKAEKRQEMADVTALLEEADHNTALSGDVRKQCLYLASVILQKNIAKLRVQQDTAGLQEVAELLETDIVARQLQDESYLAQVEEALRYIAVIQARTRQNSRNQKLLLLQHTFRRCKFQDGEIDAESLSSLARQYPAAAPAVLKKHFDSFTENGMLWNELILPEKHSQLAEMQTRAIIEKCSRCREDGKEICSDCQGTGKCRLCHGTGIKTTHKQIHFASGDTWSFQQGWRRSVPFTPQRSQTENCPAKCASCEGTGSFEKTCSVCDGRKYLIHRDRLRELLQAQYQTADALLSDFIAVSSRN